ncbi:preprotein translocase subunit YajC [Streptococcus sp. CSL10205-OR2]|uniref:preprotein translocase subunit YajC n=1 Tax=Streptococcus sp. CSL10205-OR2 TaxID=2980558 RepID=UPI0021DB1790|nr:preprotein translocase subunit YajC [Streptococcus sp. CSL10205-OR2]MCU9533945.1 preprotein translocase subunit YajC [Streptococcus sp. CSL10205-OR2]
MNFNLTMLGMFAIFVGITFFMQRQQKKQMQKRLDELKTMSKGDEIVTIGGMFALVDEVDKDHNKVVLDAEGVYLTYELTSIKRIVSRANEPVVSVEDAKESVVESAIEE